ncbi:MAG: glycosyltransferase family 4 protein [Deltaproteobacteria bacterium]|nr:glycosyltransferase family 4 protein [Deltaproteobacteria bacterium]
MRDEERLKVCLDLRYLQRACENSRTGGWGGVGTYSANLWSALARRETRVLVQPLLIKRPVTPKFRSVLKAAEERRRVECPVLGHRLMPARLLFGKYFAILQLIESEILLARALLKQDLDVIRVPDQTVPPPVKFAKVVTVHDVPFRKEERRAKFKRFYLRRLVGRADRLVCDSRATAEELLAFDPEAANKISICPPGLDLNVFRPGRAEPARVAACFQLSMPFFLHVGVCAGRKNPDGILEAVARVRTRVGPTFEMAFVGPYQVNRAALAYLTLRGERLGISDQLRFLGDVSTDELVMLYRNSAALVFPSLMEGFGYPAVEALACGKPCIISDEGAVAEVVGEVGLRVNAESSEEIASAMIAVLRGRHKDVRAIGPALAARFGAASMADHLIEIYENLRKTRPTIRS